MKKPEPLSPVFSVVIIIIICFVRRCVFRHCYSNTVKCHLAVDYVKPL